MLDRSCDAASGAFSIPLIIVGTVVRIVGRYFSITSNNFSGVERSANKAVAPPTANGNRRFVPVAYPKKSFGTDTVRSFSFTPIVRFAKTSVLYGKQRWGGTQPFG